MIEGMTILSKGTQATIWLFVMFVLLFFCIIFGFCLGFSRDNKDVFGCLLLVFIGMMGMVMMCADPSYPIVEATVSETASWSEISQRYKLIEKRGEIHVFEVLEEDKKDMEADSDCECKCNCRK